MSPTLKDKVSFALNLMKKNRVPDYGRAYPCIKSNETRGQTARNLKWSLAGDSKKRSSAQEDSARYRVDKGGEIRSLSSSYLSFHFLPFP